MLAPVHNFRIPSHKCQFLSFSGLVKSTPSGEDKLKSTNDNELEMIGNDSFEKLLKVDFKTRMTTLVAKLEKQ